MIVGDGALDRFGHNSGWRTPLPATTIMRLSPLLLLSPLLNQHLPTTQSTTLVDALSADNDYASLLRLLQRARLIPTLNKLNGSTLFAPTNDAIKRHTPWHDALTSDNIHEQLRQELFYHLLNYSIPGLPNQPETQVHKTLLFPRTHVDPPSRHPPPSPPWLPIPGGTLGGQPQRLRVASRDGSAWVGVDADGNGGVQIVKGQVNVRNGVLLGIADVLSVPPDLGVSCVSIQGCF